ncbi:MAG: hypothetical protein IPL88_10015 [Rhizobiales bacterium]|nr:hypothetical protein [Hyphomicrobiales bacterium]
MLQGNIVAATPSALKALKSCAFCRPSDGLDDAGSTGRELTMHPARLAAALPMLAVAPASTTEFCGLRPTGDGFVAPRAAPPTKARRLARMRVGDEVLARQGARGPWVEAPWRRRDTRLTRGFQTGKRGSAVRSPIEDLCG